MAVDKKISQLASGAPAQAGDEYVVARSGANYKLTLTNIAASMPPIGATTPNTGSFTSLTNSGNLTFSSTGQRITGDTVNATASNRLAFQNSTPNSTTSLNVIPNGTTTNTLLSLEGDSAYANGPFVQVANNPQSSNEARITSGIRGTASYMPLTIYTGGSERMRLDTSGNLGIGTTPSAADTFPFLQLGGAAGIIGAVNNYNLLSNAYYGSGGWKYVGTGNAVRYGGDTSGNHIFYGAASGTAGNAVTWLERMRIDSSGNVGIGVTPSAWGSDTRALQLVSRTSLSDLQNTAQLTNNGYWNGSGWIYIASAAAANYFQQDGAHIWRSAASGTAGNAITFSERMRIDSSGNVGIGTATTSGAKTTIVAGNTVTNSRGNVFVYTSDSAAANYGGYLTLGGSYSGTLEVPFAGIAGRYDGSGISGYMSFSTLSGGTLSERMRVTSGGNLGVGQGTPNARLDVLADSGDIVRFINSSVVGVSLAAGSTSFTTLSDERSKTDLVPINDAVSKLKELRTVVGRYNQDAVGVERSFLIAQDVQKVFAPAVDTNKPDELGLRYTDMIPLLVAAINELSAKVAALEAK